MELLDALRLRLVGSINMKEEGPEHGAQRTYLCSAQLRLRLSPWIEGHEPGPVGRRRINCHTAADHLPTAQAG
jgi:hypothetical protein